MTQHESLDFGPGPTNADFDWTDEQEARAAGLPSAQDSDYSEEPLEFALQRAEVKDIGQTGDPSAVIEAPVAVLAPQFHPKG